MQYTLIINPRAGRKAGIRTNAATRDDVLAALAAHDLRPDVVETARPGHATDLARAAAQAGYDAVIVAGGDGTVREAAIGLLGAQAPLGIMPLGSVMNVARMLGVPRDLTGAAAVIAADNRAYIDVGRAGTTYFLEAAGVGLDAALFDCGNKLDRGHWEALGAALRVALRYRPQRVMLELDGWLTMETEAMMVTVANGPYCGAALHVAPNAEVDDHQLDVHVFGPMPKLALLWRLLRGHAAADERARVYAYRVREVRISAPRPLPVHADSWPAGTTPLRFSLLPGALAVFVGPGARATHPTHSAHATLAQPSDHLALTSPTATKTKGTRESP